MDSPQELMFGNFTRVGNFSKASFFKGKFISKQRTAIPAGIIKEDICLSPLFFKVALKGCCHCEAGQEVPRLADSGKNYR